MSLPVETRRPVEASPTGARLWLGLVLSLLLAFGVAGLSGSVTVAAIPGWYGPSDGPGPGKAAGPRRAGSLASRSSASARRASPAAEAEVEAGVEAAGDGAGRAPAASRICDASRGRFG